MHFLILLAHGITNLSSWIINHKAEVGMAAGAMGLTSFTLEPVKKLLGLSNTKLADHFKLLRFIPVVRSLPTVTVVHYLFALLLVGIHYLQGSHSSNPVIVLGQAFVILGGNQFVYPTFVQPVSRLLSDAKAQANVNKVLTTASAAVKQSVAPYNG